MLGSKAFTGILLMLFFTILNIIISFSSRISWDLTPLKIYTTPLTYWPLSSHSKLSSHPEGDLSISSNLRRLCNETIWTDGLWLQCHSRGKRGAEEMRSFHGGLNNIRNSLQTCLRLAINAGTGVIIPKISINHQEHLKDLDGEKFINASDYWNMDHLHNVMQRHCPQLQIRFDLDGIDRTVDSRDRYYKHSRYHNSTFREEVFSTLRKANTTAVLPDDPVAISFGDTFLAWDYEVAGELSTIQKDLFKTLIYNQTLLDLSLKILKSPELKNGYIGAHIRGEVDWPRPFGMWPDQIRLYTEEIRKLNRSSTTELKTIYASCGNRSVIQTFRAMVAPLGYRVHDRWSLLTHNPVMLEKIENLMFDEKKVVEYMMLVNSNFFVGPAMSSMSSLIAYARAVNDPKNFFPTYIYPGSKKLLGSDGLGLRRMYPRVPLMKGTNRSKLMVVDGDDIMNCFP